MCVSIQNFLTLCKINMTSRRKLKISLRKISEVTIVKLYFLTAPKRGIFSELFSRYSTIQPFLTHISRLHRKTALTCHILQQECSMEWSSCKYCLSIAKMVDTLAPFILQFKYFLFLRFSYSNDSTCLYQKQAINLWQNATFIVSQQIINQR